VAAHVSIVGAVETATALAASLLQTVSPYKSLTSVPHLYAPYLNFALAWALGGPIATTGHAATAFREQLSVWWRKNAPASDFPAGGLVWDYCVEVDTGHFVPWQTRLHVSDSGADRVRHIGNPLMDAVVPTARMYAIDHVSSLLQRAGRPVLLVGGTAVGKSTLLLRGVSGGGSGSGLDNDATGTVDIHMSRLMSASHL